MKTMIKYKTRDLEQEILNPVLLNGRKLQMTDMYWRQ